MFPLYAEERTVLIYLEQCHIIQGMGYTAIVVHVSSRYNWNLIYGIILPDTILQILIFAETEGHKVCIIIEYLTQEN